MNALSLEGFNAVTVLGRTSYAHPPAEDGHRMKPQERRKNFLRPHKVTEPTFNLNHFLLSIRSNDTEPNGYLNMGVLSVLVN